MTKGTAPFVAFSHEPCDEHAAFAEHRGMVLLCLVYSIIHAKETGFGGYYEKSFMHLDSAFFGVIFNDLLQGWAK